MLLPPQFDFERILNDFALLTCLAGNDFLPNVPSLDIYDRPSALDTLMVRWPPARGCIVPHWQARSCTGGRTSVRQV